MLCYCSVEVSSSISQWFRYINGVLKCNRLAVHFRLTLDMIFVVLYKFLNCAVDKAIDAGHTAITNCN